jgi:hypothetical protein
MDAGGRFAFQGLPGGDVSVKLSIPDAAPQAGYRLSAKNKCLDPITLNHLEGSLERDVTDLTILLEPGAPIEPSPPYDHIDLTTLADYYDAARGPITGVSPGDYPPISK